MSRGPRRVGLLRWRSESPSGGNTYDEELVGELRRLGWDIPEYRVDGPWPYPSEEDRERVGELLAAEDEWLIGNIVASAIPAEIVAATGKGRRVTMILHYFPADDPALSDGERERVARAERVSVGAADAVVATSNWAAREVERRYGRGDVVVATPGNHAKPLNVRAEGSAPTFLWLGRVTPGKDPLTFVEALGRLQDLGWRAEMVGPIIDDRLEREISALISQGGLADRLEVCGPREGAALEEVWARTDLLVHTSRAETYGMVIGEALARGIPAVVAAGTGAGEAQGAGGRFRAGDAASLARVLRAWLSDPLLRSQWEEEAKGQRKSLPTWAQTAQSVAGALG